MRTATTRFSFPMVAPLGRENVRKGRFETSKGEVAYGATLLPVDDAALGHAGLTRELRLGEELLEPVLFDAFT